jgi:carbon-monoxide dehydrogenase small subunit
MSDMHDVSFSVNGEVHRLTIESRQLLADVLRHDLGYTGTHVGCEQGVCGACTVVVDGCPVRSCIVFGVQIDGSSVETVEGLADNGSLCDLQRAFSKNHALQCGFCTPGFLMIAQAYLAESDSNFCATDVREAMAANLCRCTGYQGIVDAVCEVGLARAEVNEE